DGQKLQFDTLDTTAGSGLDWFYNKKYCIGTAIQNSAVYQFNWFHCDSWEGLLPTKQAPGIPQENVLDGLSLSGQTYNWQFDPKMPANNVTQFNHYTFIIGTKLLRVTDVGGEVI